MFTIKGSSYDIVDSPLNLAGIVPNFDAAIQCGPWLLKDGMVAQDSGGDLDKYWARTSIGLGGRFLYFLVADGEGNPGSSGATQLQLAAFYHDVLHASKAMRLDGGGSTQLVLPGAGGRRFVNTMTGEDNQYDKATDGRVFSFVSARAASRRAARSSGPVVPSMTAAARSSTARAAARPAPIARRAAASSARRRGARSRERTSIICVYRWYGNNNALSLTPFGRT
jgi:Phosphodiester glycosidase